VLPHRFEL